MVKRMRPLVEALVRKFKLAVVFLVPKTVSTTGGVTTGGVLGADGADVTMGVK